MTFTKLYSKQLRSMSLAFGLIISSTFTSAWGAEFTPVAFQDTHPLATETNNWSSGRILAIGLGAIGGVAVYTLVTGDWGWGWSWGIATTTQTVAAIPATVASAVTAPGVAATVPAAITVPAAEFVAAWGGRRVFISASALVGAMIGDMVYGK